jgi:S-layer protein
LAGAATFSQYLDAAIVAAVAGATTKGAAWFQFGGNTYLVAEGATGSGDTYGSGDAVVEITGLVDLSKAVFNATTGDLTIA